MQAYILVINLNIGTQKCVLSFIPLSKNYISSILKKSIIHFNNAKNFIEKITKNNSKILFVGTKRAARDIVSKYATEAKMPYVNIRWLGGMLTNFDTVKKSIQKLDNLNSQLNTSLIDGLTKKESLVIKKTNSQT